jgi:hypothetical protein
MLFSRISRCFAPKNKVAAESRPNWIFPRLRSLKNVVFRLFWPFFEHNVWGKVSISKNAYHSRSKILMRTRITIGRGVANQKPGLQGILKITFLRFFYTSHKISIGDRRACRFSALERTILAKQRPKCTVQRRPSTGGGRPSEKFGHLGHFWTRMGFSTKKHYFSDRFQLWTKMIHFIRQCPFGHAGTLSDTRVLWHFSHFLSHLEVFLTDKTLLHTTWRLLFTQNGFQRQNTCTNYS